MAFIAHVPTDDIRKKVDAMAGYGVPHDLIARVLNMSTPTLVKYYKEELETAHVRANTAVAQALFKKAIGDGPQSVTAAIFWAKTRMGWKEPASEYENDAAVGKKARQAILARKAAHDKDGDWGSDLAPTSKIN